MVKKVNSGDQRVLLFVLLAILAVFFFSGFGMMGVGFSYMPSMMYYGNNYYGFGSFVFGCILYAFVAIILILLIILLVKLIQKAGR